MGDIEIILENRDKRECLFHLALIKEGWIKWKSESSDNELRLFLNERGTFEKVYQKIVPLFANPVNVAKGFSEKTLCSIANTNFSLLTVVNDKFPERLRVEGPPALYVQGNVDYLRQPSIAVIGSRSLEEQNDFVDISSDAKRALENIVKNDKVVVSGLAKGCDSLAHSLSMELGGKTLGVLGVGLHQFYPKENCVLQEKMSKEQCVVSQYPVGCDTYDRSGRAFVHRDLTQTLLSDEVLVIFAPDKSGAMHAVNRALKQGKKVYALDVNFNRNFDWVKKGVVRYEASSD